MTIDLTKMDRFDVRPCIEWLGHEGDLFEEEYDTKQDALADKDAPACKFEFQRMFWRVVIWPALEFVDGPRAYPECVADFETEQQARDVACALQFVLYKYHHK